MGATAATVAATESAGNAVTITLIDEKKEALRDIVKGIDGCLTARGQEQHDAALKRFEDALDYYLERQRQDWVR